MKDDFKALMDIKREAKKDLVVFLIIEDLASFKSPVKDVVESSRIFDAKGAGHDEGGDYQGKDKMSNVKT
jgi:hypothetical protein